MEKEMATQSSVLAWRIPGTEQPGGLLSMGLHRVGHDWSDLAAAGATIREEACEEQELVVIEGGGISGGEGLSKASLVIS